MRPVHCKRMIWFSAVAGLLVLFEWRGGVRPSPLPPVPSLPQEARQTEGSVLSIPETAGQPARQAASGENSARPRTPPIHPVSESASTASTPFPEAMEPAPPPNRTSGPGRPPSADPPHRSVGVHAGTAPPPQISTISLRDRRVENSLSAPAGRTASAPREREPDPSTSTPIPPVEISAVPPPPEVEQISRHIQSDILEVGFLISLPVEDAPPNAIILTQRIPDGWRMQAAEPLAETWNNGDRTVKWLFIGTEVKNRLVTALLVREDPAALPELPEAWYSYRLPDGSFQESTPDHYTHLP